LRQHRGGDEVVGEESAHPVTELVANGGPGARDLEIPEVMRHEARARAEDGEVEAALTHESKLVAFDRLAQLVVADLQLGWFRHLRRVAKRGDLAIAPRLERLGRGRVVAVDVDDHQKSLERIVDESLRIECLPIVSPRCTRK
jgi:hypothetical protein